MKYSKLKLLQLLQNVPRQGWTWQKIKDLVDSLWRDSSTEEDPKFFAAMNTSKHYTGFPDRTATSLLFTDATFTLTLTATADPIWIDGVSYPINTLTKTLSEAQELVSGLYWFWITAPDGVPQLNVDILSPGFDKCLVATAYWNTTTKKGMLSDERHWMGRDKWMHEYLHETVGARYSSGMAGSFTDTTISIEAGEFYDEDIEHEWDDPQTEVEVLYHNGSAAWEWDVLSTPYKVVSPGTNNNLRYNNGNNLATVDNNKYANYWVFATADTSHPIHVVIGTAQYTTITLARAAAVPSLGALVSAEAKLIFKVTYQNNSGSPRYMEATDYRTSSNLPSTGYVPTDHGSLSGLTDDDHPQYSKTDSYVTGISYSSETHILTLTRNNNLPDLTYQMVGIDGTNGIDGNTPYIQNQYWYIDGVNTGVLAEGIPGEAGTRGSIIRSGNTIPYPFTPAWEGDFYIDTDTFQLFGPIDGSGLADYIYIKGADGINGADGDDGLNGTDGDDGREVELRENAGWIEWRYVGEASWTQLYELPTSETDTAIQVSIDFVDANELEFVYNCPVALVFTSQVSEGADATISPVLNTNMAQYGKVTVTAPGVGLIVLLGNTL
jgi:hypothetical protein